MFFRSTPDPYQQVNYTSLAGVYYLTNNVPANEAFPNPRPALMCDPKTTFNYICVTQKLA